MPQSPRVHTSWWGAVRGGQGPSHKCFLWDRGDARLSSPTTWAHSLAFYCTVVSSINHRRAHSFYGSGYQRHNDHTARVMRLAPSWIPGTKKDAHLICSKAPWCVICQAMCIWSFENSLPLKHTHTYTRIDWTIKWCHFNSPLGSWWRFYWTKLACG